MKLRFHSGSISVLAKRILNGFLAQVMVDAVDLVFVEMLVQGTVELLRGFQVGTERLFHNDAVQAARLGEAELIQEIDDRVEILRDNGKIEHDVGAGTFPGLVQLLLQALIELGLAQVSRHVGETLRKARGDLLVHLVAEFVVQHLIQMLKPGFLRVVLTPQCQDAHVAGNAACGLQIIEARQQLDGCQIAGCTKNDKMTWSRDRFLHTHIDSLVFCLYRIAA